MARFKRILFPVEFSPQCVIAGTYVAAYARHFDAQVDLIHVEIPPPHDLYYWEPRTSDLTQQLEKFLVTEFAGLKVQRELLRGDPAIQIVRRASSHKADLIMLPTHGRGMFRRFMLGSVAAKVLHDTPYPVWTSAHLEEEQPAAPPNLKSIVCAVDLDDTGVHTLRYAGNFAREVRAQLTVAHAVPAIEMEAATYLHPEVQADLMTAARSRLTEMLERACTEGMLCVGTGNIAQFVKHAAQLHNAGLVIIGRGANGLLGRIRTHDYAIIRECERPVLSI
jgi:nucleotide-binding universal stress UspA family protein